MKQFYPFAYLTICFHHCAQLDEWWWWWWKNILLLIIICKLFPVKIKRKILQFCFIVNLAYICIAGYESKASHHQQYLSYVCYCSIVSFALLDLETVCLCSCKWDRNRLLQAALEGLDDVGQCKKIHPKNPSWLTWVELNCYQTIELVTSKNF